MKSFYEMMRILENQMPQDQEPNVRSQGGELATAEEKRRHFGIQGTGGGRTDDSVIYNDLEVLHDEKRGEMIVWFDDEKDLDDIYDTVNDIVGTSWNAGGYADVSGGPWNFDYKFTVRLADDPNTEYKQMPHQKVPMNVPKNHGPGIVTIEVDDVYTDDPPKTYHPFVGMTRRGNSYG